MKKNSKKTIKISLLILIVVFVLFISSLVRVDPDYFWHIKAGEYMAKHGILKTDVFSWYMFNKPWMSHEWLFEILIFYLSKLGPYFKIIFIFISFGIVEFILFKYNRNNYLKNIPFTLFWIICGLIFVYYLQIRPHMVSYIFLTLTIYFLYDLYNNPDSKKIYFLPLVAMLWANIHGGSSNLSYIFCLIFLLGGLFSFNSSKVVAKRINKKQIIKYGVVTLLCVIFISFNVHGIKMLIYPYQNMADKLMINNISEWRSTTLNDLGHYPYFILVGIIALIFLFSKKKIVFLDLILFGCTLFLGLKSIRFWPYIYLVMSFVIFNYIGPRKYDKGTNLCINIISILILVMSIVNIVNYRDLDNINLDSKIINILKREDPKRIYNMYDYGGELIYNDILVFVDGRADLYSNDNLKDYLDISHLRGDYVKLIDKYNFDYFLVDKNYPINMYLKYNDLYECIYKNKKILLYKKIST